MAGAVKHIGDAPITMKRACLAPLLLSLVISALALVEGRSYPFTSGKRQPASGGPRAERLPASPHQMRTGCQLTLIQRTTALALARLFEHGGINKFGHEICELRGDGRGFTVGTGRFCTAYSCQSVANIVNNYYDVCRKPVMALSQYQGLLNLPPGINDDIASQTPDFCSHWAETSRDSCFQSVQHQEAVKSVVEPSQKMADVLTLRYALSRAVLLDTALQHGIDGNSEASLEGIVAAATKLSGVVPGDSHLLADEIKWVRALLQARRDVIDAAGYIDEASLARLDAWEHLLVTGQLSLAGVVTLDTAYFDKIALPGAHGFQQDAANC